VKARIAGYTRLKRPAGWLPRKRDQLRLLLNIGLSLSLPFNRSWVSWPVNS